MADEKPGLNFDGRPVDGGAIRIVPNKVLTDQQLRDRFNQAIKAGQASLPAVTPPLAAAGQKWSDHLFQKRDDLIAETIRLETEIEAHRVVTSSSSLTPDSVVTPEGKPVGFAQIKDQLEAQIQQVNDRHLTPVLDDKGDVVTAKDGSAITVDERRKGLRDEFMRERNFEPRDEYEKIQASGLSILHNRNILLQGENNGRAQELAHLRTDLELRYYQNVVTGLEKATQEGKAVDPKDLDAARGKVESLQTPAADAPIAVPARGDDGIELPAPLPPILTIPGTQKPLPVPPAPTLKGPALPKIEPAPGDDSFPLLIPQDPQGQNTPAPGEPKGGEAPPPPPVLPEVSAVNLNQNDIAAPTTLPSNLKGALAAAPKGWSMGGTKV